MVAVYRFGDMPYFRALLRGVALILKEANLQIEGDDAHDPIMNKLKIADRQVDAIFFHNPDEPFGFLSNWFYSPFSINNMYFVSTGQYIMHRKCLLFGDEESAKAILATENPEIHKSIGHQTKGIVNNVWAGSRQLIAVKGIHEKFSQNNNLKNKLFETDNAYLVECTNTDTIWACGKSLYEPDRLDAGKWNGQNILGFSLMKVREELQAMRKRI